MDGVFRIRLLQLRNCLNRCSSQIPALLGLPARAWVHFVVAQYAAANDWQYVIGLMKVSSWLAFGCGALVATFTIPTVLSFKSFLDPGYVAPTIVALAGIPIVALTIVRSEAIRGLGWLALAWGPFQLGQPLLLLIVTAVMVFIVMPLTATIGVAASILAAEPHCAMGSFAGAAWYKDKRCAQSRPRRVASSRRVLHGISLRHCDPSSGWRRCG